MEEKKRQVEVRDWLARRCGEDIIVDLREAELFAFGTIPGAVNIPLSNLAALYRLPKGPRILVFCQSGEISGQIVELLLDAGYDAWELTGGYRAYLRSRFSEQNGKK